MNLSPEQQKTLTEIHEFIGARLAEIGQVVPYHKLTLILRHPDNEKACAVCSDDDDLQAAVDMLIESKALRDQKVLN